jgi:hypothetical protein
MNETYSERIDPYEKRINIRKDVYLCLFLDQNDFGSNFQLEKDNRLNGADGNIIQFDDLAFSKNQGIWSGFNLWTSRPGDYFLNFYDIRWVFPTAGQAGSYHRNRLMVNSEGLTPMPNSPKVGQECELFGLTNEDMGVNLTALNYLFYVKQVVVKLFGSFRKKIGDQSINEQQSISLTFSLLFPFANKIIKRIENNI